MQGNTRITKPPPKVRRGFAVQPLFFNKFCQGVLYYFYIDRFCYVCVHSAFQAPFHIVCKCVGSHGDNRQILVGVVQLSYSDGSFISRHYGHTDIHQYCFVRSRFGIFKHIYADLTVFGVVAGNSYAVEQRFGNFPVQVVVFRK